MITVAAHVEDDMSLASLVDQVALDVQDSYANSDVSMMVMMQRTGVLPPSLPSVVLNVIEVAIDGDWDIPGVAVTPLQLSRDGRPCLTGEEMWLTRRSSEIMARLPPKLEGIAGNRQTVANGSRPTRIGTGRTT